MDYDIKSLAGAPPEREVRGDDEPGAWARSEQGMAAWPSRARGKLLWRMALQRSDPAWRRALVAAGGEFPGLARIPDGVADELAGVSV